MKTIKYIWIFALLLFLNVPVKAIEENENMDTVSDELLAGIQRTSKSSMDEQLKKFEAISHVISHRGASAQAVEHTFEAYDLAIAQGSYYIEQDLVSSKDGTLYISHDLNASRLTGYDGLYSQMSDSQINELKTSSNEKIHTLQSVFDRYKTNTFYVIELKEAGQVDAFVNIVQKNGLEDFIIVQSNDENVIEQLEAKLPNIRKLLLVNKKSALDEAVHSSADIISVKKSLMNRENLEKVRNSGKIFNVYTLDTPQEIIEAIQLGVDSYFTDDTQNAINYELEYR